MKVQKKLLEGVKVKNVAAEGQKMVIFEVLKGENMRMSDAQLLNACSSYRTIELNSVYEMACRL